MTFEELAWEFAEVFHELDTPQINEMLAKNVPLDTLEFFGRYSKDFGAAESIVGPNAKGVSVLARQARSHCASVGKRKPVRSQNFMQSCHDTFSTGSPLP